MDSAADGTTINPMIESISIGSHAFKNTFLKIFIVWFIVDFWNTFQEHIIDKTDYSDPERRNY